MWTKKELRTHILELRKELQPSSIQMMSDVIVNKIRSLPVYQNAKIVTLFYPLEGEVNLLSLLEDDKTFCFPKIENFTEGKMSFYQKGEVFFQTSKFGLTEPTGEHMKKEEIDLYIIPGLAFSRKGDRLGFGKGFYDRYLENALGYKLGVGFDFQIVDDMEHDSYDVILNQIITNQEELCTQV